MITAEMLKNAIISAAENINRHSEDVDDINVTLHSVDIRTHVEFVREIQGTEFVCFCFEHNCFWELYSSWHLNGIII